ncbi:unnamed protein product [Mytilus edulis]|uniref:ATP-dependent DNA helicase n=1 Tax=Mytilus edulis TaxID=6550 RepID=A0A8S3UFM9_MYTED|nr:unnamed protein product [Mytilus edulis]
MDIQMISGVYGIACYICSYICKSEPDTLKNALSDLLSSLRIQQPKPLRDKMFSVGMCVLKHRTLSAQEAAYRLSDLDFISSTRETIYLSALPPHKQYRRLKPQVEIDNMSPDSTEIFYSNLIDDYHRRPYCIEDICLFRYTQCYKRHYDKITKNCLKLLTCDRYIRMRLREAVVRVHLAQFNTDDYFYGLIQLYYPHRSFSDIIGSEKDVKLAFLKKNSLFDHQGLRNCHRTESIENAIKAIQLCQLPDFCDIQPHSHIDAQFAHDMSDNTAEHGLNNNHSVCENDNILPSQIHEYNVCHQDDTEWHNLLIGCCPNEMQSMYDKLTKDQKLVFKYISTQFNQKQEAFHVFISGGAGVGKSFLTSFLVQWMRTCTAYHSGSDPVCLCAPTGIASYHIKGMTIHSALKLPVQHGWDTTYLELGVLAMQKLKREFTNIHTLVIDEISMVSSTQLNFIHRRLTALKGNNLPFGGLNVIFVGDFFQLRPVRGTYA